MRGRAEALMMALESKDAEAYTPMLAPDVEFFTPIEPQAMRGREHASMVLRAVFTLFDDFRYSAMLEGDGQHALVFSATVRGVALKGIDLIEFNEEGLVSRFEVLIRPVPALQAIGHEMASLMGGPPPQSS